MAEQEEGTLDHGDERAVKKQRRKLKLWRERELEDLARIVQDKRVRNFLWRIMEKAKIYKFGFVAEPNLLYYQEGARAIGGFILEELLAAAPNCYTLMRAEHEEAAKGTVTTNESEEDDNG